MSKPLQKPTILNVETVAKSRLFNVESVDLEFSNGVRRVYERMRPSSREAVMIVPIVDDHLILIREYAVGTESYELGFSKGLIDPGETVFEAANRELKEEVGFGANELSFLKKLSMAPSYFSSKMNIVVAEDLYPESLEGDEPEPLPQLQLGLSFAAQSGNFRQRVITQFCSFTFSFAAQFFSISFCFCPGLSRRDFSVHFCFSSSSLAFRSDLFAFHGSFLLQQGSLLLAVLFHFVGSFLCDDQSVLHGGFHLLIVFQFGADSFHSIFKLYVILIQAFKILGNFGKKLIDLFGVISAEAFGKVLIV